MNKILFFIGALIATWCAAGCAVYFWHIAGDSGSAIATACGCLFAGGLMMVEAHS